MKALFTGSLYGDWSIGDALNAIREAKTEKRDTVTLSMADSTGANEEYIFQELQNRGFRVSRSIERIHVELLGRVVGEEPTRETVSSVDGEYIVAIPNKAIAILQNSDL